ncbi:MAG TPA: site-2 protease family protein [Phycisphaerales bacterium]|nr:site-2 protease family protein [Phycisphaerales bacterium]
MWIPNWYNAIGLVGVVSWIVIVIGSVVLHELSHGWAAIKRGDRTPIETGHMTWNPLVHMGQTGLIMFILFGIAFGAMPVNPSRFRGRHAEAFVAAAGPAMNLLLAAVCIVLGAVVEVNANQIGDPLAQNLYIFFRLGILLNIALAMFNMLPVPPLDGSRILGDFVPSFERLWQGENAQWLALGIFILLFIFAGEVIFGAGAFVADRGIDTVVGWIGSQPQP